MDSYGCGDNAVIGAVTGQLRQHLIHENASQTFLRKNVCIFWLHVPVNECFFFRCQPHETNLLVREGTLVAAGPAAPAELGGGFRREYPVKTRRRLAHVSKNTVQ